MIHFPTLTDLEDLLADVRDRAAQGEHPGLAQAIAEALKLCESARAVHAAVHLQHQGALGSIRGGCPDDALVYIERAIGMGDRWAGRVAG